jgi:hypothetical protein
MAMAEQISHETRVRDVTAALRRKLEKESNIQLDDIRGEWILYSSQYLDIYAKEPEPEIDDMGWNAGTLTIDGNEIKECVRDHDSNIGIRVDFLNGPVESYYIYLQTPQSASWIPTTWAAGGCEDVEPFNCKITFLGCGLLEMRVPGRVLVKGYGYKVPELYFVAVLTKDLAQLEHDARRMSSEWKNCPYTSHPHLDNDIQFKRLAQRYNRPSGIGLPPNSTNGGIEDDDG